MKKKNLKSLKISKVSISNLETNIVTGGASGYKYSCPRCYSDEVAECEDLPKW